MRNICLNLEGNLNPTGNFLCDSRGEDVKQHLNPALTAVSQKNMDEWLKPRIDSIDKEFADIKKELSEVKSELGGLASQVTIAVDLLKSMSGRHVDDMKVR